MSNKHKDRKMKTLENEDKENRIRLHRTNCDSLYRWSMWRMYLNEELSRVIASRHDKNDYSHSLTSITAPYLSHPDGQKHGSHMKRLYRQNIRHSESCGDILPDNMYLVYGLPRVSLNQRIPEDVQRLHDSLHELDLLHMQREKQSVDENGADEQISKLFDFVSSDEINDNNQQTRSLFDQIEVNNHGNNVSVNNSDLNVQNQRSTITMDATKVHVDVHVNANKGNEAKGNINLTTKSIGHIPPVSKSRLFWERLATKKSEIIGIGKDKAEVKDNNEYTVISDDILQKQQKLLKKPIPKRTSKDLWRTLRERKTEILQLREMSSGQNNEQRNITNPVRRRESKTSQLWGFIFHKKKELVHMKRGHKVPSSDLSKTQNGNVKKEQHSVLNDSKGNILPRNFEDSFQKELAEKLRKRRENELSVSGNL